MPESTASSAAGGTGIGNRKLPIPCGGALSDKFKFNKEILLESGQVDNVEMYSRPTGSVDANPLTFHVEPIGDTFLQSESCYFWVRCRILKADGSDVDSTDKFGVVSAFGLSFFKNLKILLNGFELSPSSENDMPYKNYLETILSYDTSQNNTFLSSSIYELDDLNHLECTSPDVGADTADKPTAFINRYNRVKDSKPFDFTMPLCCDFFRADAHLAPANKITIVATRESSNFLIQSSTAGTGGYKIKVDDIKLCYNRIRLDPTLTNKILGKPCQYLTVQTHLKKYALPSGITTYRTELYNGILPRQVIIGQVLTSAAQGDYEKNPFNFQPFDVSRVSLSKNGVIMPPGSLTPSFSENLYARSYNHMLMNSAFHRTDRTTSISYERYPRGSAFFVYDLTQDFCSSADLHKATNGSLELELEWSKALPSNITIVVYAAFNCRYVTESISQPSLFELI